MEDVVLTLEKTYANKFHVLMNIYGNDLMADKFIDYHIGRIKREIARMQQTLNKFEAKYQINSEEFYKKFETGEFGDDKDFIQWSGVYELQLDSKKQLAKLLW